MSSAALGGAFASIMNRLFPAANLSPGAFALVAIGCGVWGGVAGYLCVHHLRV
jgi:hypothetical protein